MTIETKPAAFSVGMAQDIEDARKRLASALRCCEEARSAIGPAIDIDPDLLRRSQKLDAVHAYLTYAAADLVYALDVVRLLAAKEQP